MIRTRRLLTLVAAVVVTCMAASGCDSSTYAAVVNGQVITQTAFQAELAARVSNKAYVTALDQQGAQSNLTVEGQAPGSYSAAFSVFILGQLVQADAIHQYLEDHDQSPSASALAAARSIQELQFGAAWQAFPTAVRNQLVMALAERAEVEPQPTSTDIDQAAFTANEAWFFARVCTRLITVGVAGRGGGIDFAASAAMARQIQAGYRPGQSGGLVTCFTPAQLEQRSPAFFSKVLALAPGRAAAPERVKDGYTVLAVDSRVMQVFGPGTAAVLNYVLNLNSSSTDSTPALIKVLAAANIKVNPTFGSWNRAQLSIQVPGVPARIAQMLQGVTDQLAPPA